MTERRRGPFVPDQEKFSTQRTLTYLLVLIFACVSGVVLYENDQSERSMILQTVINMTLLAVGYWLGASKQGQDQAQSMSRIAEAGPTLRPAPSADDAAVPVKIVEGAGTAGGEPLNVKEQPK